MEIPRSPHYGHAKISIHRLLDEEIRRIASFVACTPTVLAGLPSSSHMTKICAKQPLGGFGSLSTCAASSLPFPKRLVLFAIAKD